MSLLSLVEAAIPRERSGSRTAARYRFQANVSILKLLELAEDNQDFVILFDIFDDLAVLNCVEKPTEIRLYQIKSKDPGNWSTADLCKLIGSVSPRSYLSRLYAHTKIFGSALVQTGFISNASFKVKLLSRDSTAEDVSIAGNEFHSEEVEKVNRAILEDFQPADTINWLPKLILIRTSLGVHGQDLVIKGRLYQFFDMLGLADTVNLGAIYETLHASISSRTEFHEDGLNKKEILERKSLSFSEFKELIDRAARPRHNFLSDWDTIRSDLAQGGYTTRSVVRLRTRAIQYHHDRQLGQPRAVHLQRQLREWIASNRPLVDVCETICALIILLRSGVPEDVGYTDIALDAALMVEAYEIWDGDT